MFYWCVFTLTGFGLSCLCFICLAAVPEDCCDLAWQVTDKTWWWFACVMLITMPLLLATVKHCRSADSPHPTHPCCWSPSNTAGQPTVSIPPTTLQVRRQSPSHPPLLLATVKHCRSADSPHPTHPCCWPPSNTAGQPTVPIPPTTLQVSRQSPSHPPLLLATVKHCRSADSPHPTHPCCWPPSNTAGQPTVPIPPTPAAGHRQTLQVSRQSPSHPSLLLVTVKHCRSADSLHPTHHTAGQPTVPIPPTPAAGHRQTLQVSRQSPSHPPHCRSADSPHPTHPCCWPPSNTAGQPTVSIPPTTLQVSRQSPSHPPLLLATVKHCRSADSVHPTHHTEGQPTVPIPPTPAAGHRQTLQVSRQFPSHPPLLLVTVKHCRSADSLHPTHHTAGHPTVPIPPTPAAGHRQTLQVSRQSPSHPSLLLVTVKHCRSADSLHPTHHTAGQPTVPIPPTPAAGHRQTLQVSRQSPSHPPLLLATVKHCRSADSPHPTHPCCWPPSNTAGQPTVPIPPTPAAGHRQTLQVSRQSPSHPSLLLVTVKHCRSADSLHPTHHTAGQPTVPIPPTPAAGHRQTLQVSRQSPSHPPHCRSADSPHPTHPCCWPPSNTAGQPTVSIPPTTLQVSRQSPSHPPLLLATVKHCRSADSVHPTHHTEGQPTVPIPPTPAAGHRQTLQVSRQFPSHPPLLLVTVKHCRSADSLHPTHHTAGHPTVPIPPTPAAGHRQTLQVSRQSPSHPPHCRSADSPHPTHPCCWSPSNTAGHPTVPIPPTTLQVSRQSPSHPPLLLVTHF